MSSFLQKLTNPKTGKYQVAYCIDNYFGGHQYGYFFSIDGKDALLGETINTEEWDIFTEEQINCKPIVNQPIDDCKQEWEERFRSEFYKNYSKILTYCNCEDSELIDKENNLVKFIKDVRNKDEEELIKMLPDKFTNSDELLEMNRELYFSQLGFNDAINLMNITIKNYFKN